MRMTFCYDVESLDYVILQILVILQPSYLLEKMVFSLETAISQDIKSVNDDNRYDGALNFVCCSVQYPNSWYLKQVVQNNRDQIFQEYVVLYISLDILCVRNAKYCPCNASKSKGKFIDANMDNIDFIFAPTVSNYRRTDKMLSCCPTDGQAEILIENNIPLKYINGIAVEDKCVAARVCAMLKMHSIQNVPVYIAPDVLSTEWSSLVKDGRKPQEEKYNC